MIFLTEYDEKKHLRHTFEEGRAEDRGDKLKKSFFRVVNIFLEKDRRISIDML